MAKTPKKGVYIEFSKRVTMASLVGFFIALILGMAAIALLDMSEYQVAAYTSLLGTYATIVGVIVSGYFGRASIDSWSASKYAFEEVSANKHTEG